MTIPEIARKYKISEAFLNSKDDGLMVAAESLIELKGQIQNQVPINEVLHKIQILVDFLSDCKNSNH